MNYTKCLGVVFGFTALLLSSCSTAPKPAAEDTEKKEAAAPIEPVPAKTAFWPMYTKAREWATDFVTLRLVAKEVPGFTNADGKAAMWVATFGSTSKQEYREYTYSIAAHAPDIYKGVSVGEGKPWSGATRDAMAITLSDFNVDSDAAYKTAAADAAAWLAKADDKTLTTMELRNLYQFQTPTWFFFWGTKKQGYAVYVNANTGQVVKAKK